MRLAARMGTLGTESAFEVSARARALEAQGRSIIHLQIGEPDFDTPANVREAAKAALDAGATHYPPFAGIPALREAIAADASARKGFAVDPAQVFVTVGGKGVMLYAILGLVDPGDEVLVPDPGYPIYESLTRFVGATPVPIPIRMSNDFRLDVDELPSLITPRTRGIVVNSPANPTGGVLTRGDLERIAELAIEHDLWVLADEIYGRILYDGAEHVSIASLPGMAERTIVLDGFSKTFAMTGWRMGYAIVPPALAAMYGQLIINTISGVATFAQVGAVEALEGPQDDVDAMVVEFRARRDLVVNGLNAIPGIECLTPTGAFYVFPRIAGTGLSGAELAERLLHEAGVCVLPGSAFGDVRRRPHPDQLRELAGEPARGAPADPRVRRAPGGGAGMSERPRVFVSRRIPSEALDTIADACDADIWQDELPPPRDELLRRDRRLRRGADAAHRQGRRRVPRRRRPRAQGGQQLRGRVRQHRRRGLCRARRRGRQYAGRPDRDDRRPRLGAADGRRPPAARGRPIRPGRPLEDVGPAAAPRAGRPWRDARDRRFRADRPGRRAACPGLRDAHPLPRRLRRCPRRSPWSSARRTGRWRACWPRATSSRSTST